MKLRTHSKWPSIALLTLCQVMGLSLWFTATAIIPALRADMGLSDTLASLYTSMVAVGFIAGTLGSAILGLADRIPPKRFFMASAFIAALANAAIVVVGPDSNLVILLDLITGACMAGIYPVGMKIGASWAVRDIGLLIGLLVGGISLGKATPYLLNVIGGIDWRFTLLSASGFAAASGLLINLIGIGPALGKAPPFRFGAVLRAWTNKPLRLSNFGYFGHMWELYAMWAWIGVFLSASFVHSSPGSADTAKIYANLTTFAVIAMGAIGCFAGGLFADRFGRTTLTMGALATSGACALGVGFLFGGSPWPLVVVCLIWGLTVAADSPQFSACTIELSEPGQVGTMLTIQTCIGFLLTLITIHLVPPLVEAVGWRYAFAPLALGPLFGFIAMARLRASPAALRLAGGKR